MFVLKYNDIERETDVLVVGCLASAEIRADQTMHYTTSNTSIIMIMLTEMVMIIKLLKIIALTNW